MSSSNQCNLFSDNALSRIEAMFREIVDALGYGRPVCIAIKARAHASIDSSNETSVNTEYLISFPGSSSSDARKFGQLARVPSSEYNELTSARKAIHLRILQIMYSAMRTGQCITKRDIYYQDPNLFDCQSRVDVCVDNLAFTLNLARSDLNVNATAKGLCIGNFAVIRSQEVAIDGFGHVEGTLINVVESSDIVVAGAIECVLVVEKDAIFHTLANSEHWRAQFGWLAILTGKGYPDHATRIFLSRMSATASMGSLQKTALALVDFDPDGLTIFLTYKYGPQRIIHDREVQTTPGIEWIGPTSADVDLVERDYEAQVVTTLTKRDRDKASSMLGWTLLSENGAELFVRRELQVMLAAGFKFETEMLELVQGGLSPWLSRRINDVMEAIRGIH